jgi:hypothetical protein
VNVSVSSRQGILHLRLHGSESLDCANAAHVRSAVLAKVNGAQDVVVDLSGIDLLDQIFDIHPDFESALKSIREQVAEV